MQTSEAIQGRRNIKRFTDQTVAREHVEEMFAAAALAPNHRMTQPWRFYAFGPEARTGYGRALGNRKASKIEDQVLAQSIRDNTTNEHTALPLMLGVSMTMNENEEIRSEDLAATWMAVENLCIKAVDLGYGTSLKTGAILMDPAARAACGINGGEKLIVVINVGVPAEIPASKPRLSASEITKWVP